MKKPAVFFSFCTMIALAFTGGCGQKLPEGMPKLYPTKVAVKYEDGTPVANATVLLLSNDTGLTGAWSSGGTTLQDGTVDLRTHGQYLGVPAGEYKVTVKATVTEFGEPNPEGLDPDIYEKLKARYEELNANPDVDGKMITNYSIVEKIYGKIDGTPLTIKVEPVKGQSFDLTVGSPIKEVL